MWTPFCAEVDSEVRTSAQGRTRPSRADPAGSRQKCCVTHFGRLLKTKGCKDPQKADSQNPFERRQEASIVARRSRRNKIPSGVGCFDLHLGAMAPGFASVLKCDTDGRVRMSLS